MCRMCNRDVPEFLKLFMSEFTLEKCLFLIENLESLIL